MKLCILSLVRLGFVRTDSRQAKRLAVAPRSRLATLLFLVVMAWRSTCEAQAPAFGRLQHSLLDPSTRAQSSTVQGSDVAVDGNVAVVGAPWADTFQSSSGVVKLYNVANGALLLTITNPAPGLLTGFGSAVAISAGLVVIGASSDDAEAPNAGSAYIYDLSSAVPSAPVFIIPNPNPTTNAYFGSAVSIYDTRIVVAAPEDTAGTNLGIVYVFDLASATPTVPAFTLTNPTPEAGDHFGWSVAISGSRVVVGAEWDNTGAVNAGSAYVYDLAGATPTVPLVTLNNPMPLSGDTFGRSVAIAGSRVVVGADGADRAFINSGTAYVYDLSSANPSVPILALANPHPASSYFGSDVGISGTRVLVGAYNDNSPGVSAGIAYIFNLASSTPTEPVLTIPNPTPAQSDYFGEAVAISGSRFVIGAYGDDTQADLAGNAYFYDLASPTPSAPVAGPADYIPATRDYFGRAVAISGTRAVVGAYGDDTGGDNSGRAYVYDLLGATPTVPSLTLNNPTPAYEDRFGYAVAISGTRVVIGADGDDTGAESAGAAYVFDLTRPNPSVPLLTLNNPGPAAQDYFGSAVAIDGTRVVVGAYADDTGALDAGSVYVYDLTRTSPSVPWMTLTNPSPASRDYFGFSVAISGTRVLVGASRNTVSVADEGRVFVYDLTNPMPRIPILTLTNPAPASGDQFSAAVAMDGTRAVVGAYRDDAVAADEGTAFVYDFASLTPTVPVLTLSNPNEGVGELFGCAVGISGTRVVIGAYGDETGATAAGIAYVYDLAGATPGAPVLILTNPSPAFGDSFGYSVAISGTTILAGAPFDDTIAYDRGAAYLYSLAPSLRIVPSAPGFATVSWAPSISPGYVLQYTDSFAPTNWVNAPSGAVNPVTVPSANGSRFYRLFHP